MNAIVSLGQLFGIPQKQETKEVENTYFLDRSSRCQAVQHVGVCGNPITNGGVDNSGFCEECWTVDAVTAHELYHEYRKDGMDREEAIERAMINTKDGVESNPDVKQHRKVKRKPIFDPEERLFENMGNTDPMFRKVENESTDAG